MKKLLSILLALSLVISIIPAAFAEATAPTEPEVFNFVGETATLVRVAADDGTAPDGFKERWEIDGKKYYINSVYSDFLTDRYWRVVDISENIVKLNPGGSFYLHKTDGIFAKCGSKNLNAAFEIAVSLKSQYDGFYVPVLNAYCGSLTDNSFSWYIQKKKNTEEISAYKECKIVSKLSLSEAGDFKISSNKVFYAQKDEEMISVLAGGARNYKFYNITYDFVQNPKIEIASDKTVLDTTDNKTATITSTVTGDNQTTAMDVADGFVKYYSDNEAVATVDADTGEITAVATGEANITAKSPDGAVVSTPVTVTVKKEDEALTGAFVQEAAKEDITGSYTAPTVAGLEIDGSVITPDSNGDGSYNLTAPETKGDKKFLYWAKGMETKKRIISFSNVLEKYVPDSTGITYLIAVYEGDITDTKNEYYNLNGQLIAKQETAPDLPSIPGLGTAEGWESCGANIWVAEYAAAAPTANITITAGDNCTLNKTGDYAYGEEVICTATGTGTFKCWKKNDEIVSIDESYSFRAWEDCTVEAVYEDYYYTGSNMNILIDSFSIDTGVTGVMAEFIGFDSDDVDVVEKGIMFTDSEEKTTKIPMTTTDNQLTVVADEAGKYAGYAILRNGSAYTLITDGLYEHN